MKETPNRASYEALIRRQEEERNAERLEAHGNALEMNSEIDTLRKEIADRQARLDALTKGTSRQEQGGAPSPSTPETGTDSGAGSLGGQEQHPHAEEIAGLKNQINAINRAIQQNTILSPEFAREFGVDFKFNRSTAMAWAEGRVLELENRIRELEQDSLEDDDEDDNGDGGDNDTPPSNGGMGNTNFFTNIEYTQGPTISLTDVRTFENSFNNYNLKFNSDNVTTSEDNRIDNSNSNNTNIEDNSQTTINVTINRGLFAGLFNRPPAQPPLPTPENPGANTRSTWGWIKQRLKNAPVFGAVSLRNAEMMRRSTNAVAENARGEAVELHQTRDLSYENALTEANLIRAVAEERGGMSRENIAQVSAERTAVQEAYNEQLINTIIGNSQQEVQRRLARYQDEYNEGIVSEEHMRSLETGLRESLMASTVGLENRGDGAKREVNFVQSMRERLNPNWRRQYVYAGAEFVASTLIYKTGLSYLASKTPFFNGLFAPTGLETAAPTPTGLETAAPTPTGVESVTPSTTGVENAVAPSEPTSVWSGVEDLLEQKGISDPSNEIIADITKSAAEAADIASEGLGTTGSITDTSMSVEQINNVLQGDTVQNGVAEAVQKFAGK